tara:strand:+ start:2708 stop:3268 length:561 start_codon:yes stop_codon:yes gene_type:complete
MKLNIQYIIIILSVIFFSCEKDKHIRVYKIKKQIPQEKEEIKLTSKADPKFEWDAPKEWREVQGHSMRIVSFEVPSGTSIGDLSITSFSGASGGIQANVNRWENQIGLTPSSLDMINKISESRTSKLGKYEIYELINFENKNSAIIASIFKLKEITLFVKLSIGVAGLKTTRNQFIKFCDSIGYIK